MTITPNTTRTAKTYTVDELLAMDDFRFGAAATADLRSTSNFKSNFQHADVVDRTAHALVEKLWFVDSQLESQAEDPGVTPEHYQRTLAFRRHLLSVIDLTERRADRNFPGVKTAKAWRAVLHDLCDEIEGTELDDLLDEFVIPFPIITAFGDSEMTLRTWIERRRVKDPSRVPAKEGVAA